MAMVVEDVAKPRANLLPRSFICQILFSIAVGDAIPEAARRRQQSALLQEEWNVDVRHWQLLSGSDN
eukprot:6287518-Amphidinium_carterae.1